MKYISKEIGNPPELVKLQCIAGYTRLVRYQQLTAVLR